MPSKPAARRRSLSRSTAGFTAAPMSSLGARSPYQRSAKARLRRLAACPLRISLGSSSRGSSIYGPRCQPEHAGSGATRPRPGLIASMTRRSKDLSRFRGYRSRRQRLRSKLSHNPVTGLLTCLIAARAPRRWRSTFHFCRASCSTSGGGSRMDTLPQQTAISGCTPQCGTASGWENVGAGPEV